MTRFPLIAVSFLLLASACLTPRTETQYVIASDTAFSSGSGSSGGGPEGLRIDGDPPYIPIAGLYVTSEGDQSVTLSLRPLRTLSS